MFFKENAQLLQEFSRVSKTAGARADYVQGGGGNTSVKLAGGLMAIKASGFCLSDIEPDKAYAVLDGAAVRDFYLTSEPEQFENVETAGSAKAKESVKTIEGLAQLRPSVEAGFHSILKTFVVHTHSVYANLAACAVNCREICEAAFDGAGLKNAIIPEGVTEIHDWAFRSNEYLESIHFPSTVEFLGQTIIGMCPNLRSITGKFSSADKKSLIIDGELISIALYELRNYTIPPGVHTIGEDLFWANEIIENVITVALRRFR